jgi:hypothetical protein
MENCIPLLFGRNVRERPAQMQAAQQRLFPLNGYTALMGGIVNVAFPDDRAIHKSMGAEVMALPGIRAIVGQTSDWTLTATNIKAAARNNIPLNNPDGSDRPARRVLDDIEHATITINDQRKVLNDIADNFARRIKAKLDTPEMAQAWIATVPDKAEQARLISRINDKVPSIKLKNIPRIPDAA